MLPAGSMGYETDNGPPLPDLADPAKRDRESWFRLYLANGISVIPLEPGTKRPYAALVPQWGLYSQRFATLQEVRYWIETAPEPPDIGAILGTISGELTAFDVEKSQFSYWLEQYCSDYLLQKTWTNRTGAGLLHVLVRSEVPVRTQDLPVPPGWPKDDGSPKKNKTTLAEIRANTSGAASYVVVPPSGHPSGGVYSIMYGGPQSVVVVKDAHAMFKGLADTFGKRWSAQHAPTLAPVGEAPEPETIAAPANLDLTTVPMAIRTPLPPGAKLVIIERIKKSGIEDNNIFRLMFQGPLAGADDEGKDTDRSRADFKVCMALRQSGFTWSEIEDFYATFEIGRAYRDTNRSNHGRRYLWYTLNAVDTRIQEVLKASRQARGLDFIVTKVLLWPHEDAPYYDIQIETMAGEVVWARLKARDLTSEVKFSDSVFESCNIVIRFQPDQKKRENWKDFQQALAQMAEKQPLTLSREHHIRSVIGKILDRSLKPMRPQDHNWRLGWRENGYLYINPSDLLTAIQVQGFRDVRIPDVSQVLYNWGAWPAYPKIMNRAVPMLRISESILSDPTLNFSRRRRRGPLRTPGDIDLYLPPEDDEDDDGDRYLPPPTSDSQDAGEDSPGGDESSLHRQ